MNPSSRIAPACVALVVVFAPAVRPLGAQDAEPTIPSAAAARPGIVVVMTDDQGFGDLGVNGNPVLETPNIDRLAGESASLRYFYVSPVCTPTRACLMTGRYNYRTRAIDTWIGRAMMEPEEVTLAEILGAAGYRTGIFGKWHLGDCYPMRPIDQGFDEALVHRGGGLAQPSEPLENDRRYTDALLFRNGKQVETKGYCTDVYFDAAIEFIAESHASGEPFFVYVPTNAPHDPLHDVPGALHEKYRTRDLSAVLLGRPQEADRVARIYAMIENIDENVGKLLAALARLGIDRDTIVVYLHDNGPQTARYVGPMRGTKSGVHEGGIRSPFFVRWPERLSPGTTSERAGAHVDVLPTLLEAAGVAPPDGLRLDGRSLLPLLEGRDVEWPERYLFIQTHRGDAPVRYHHFAVRGPRWKLLCASGFGRETPPADTPYELYDVTADPYERRNLASEHAEIVERMKAAYDRWFDDVGSTRPDNYDPPRIVVGSDHETQTVLTHQDWRRRAGNGWGAEGTWLLSVVGDHAFDVRVIAREDLENTKLTLRLGETTRTVTVEGPTRSAKIAGVRVPPGDADLEVVIEAGDERITPYHVVVTRVSP